MLLTSFKQSFPLIVHSLAQAASQRRLAHAYLLHSDQSVLRQTFSLALAQLAACPHKLPEGFACGVCSCCLQIEHRSYAELITLVPTSKSRKILIGDDEHDFGTVRWFEHQFYYKSNLTGEVKIGIIHDAECLQVEAQNALLKTLEEPPGQCLFILTTANPSSLLNTIRSRCQPLLLLTNRCDYDFPGFDQLMETLTLLSQPHGTMSRAEQSYLNLMDLAESLFSHAEKRTRKNSQNAQQAIAELENKKAKEEFEDRLKAAIQADYLHLRQQFLSAIHTWFTYNYTYSCQLQIPRGEDPVWHWIQRQTEKPTEPRAHQALLTAERLMQTLNWNVSQDLALKEFCLALTMPHAYTP